MIPLLASTTALAWLQTKTLRVSTTTDGPRARSRKVQRPVPAGGPRSVAAAGRAKSLDLPVVDVHPVVDGAQVGVPQDIGERHGEFTATVRPSMFCSAL